IRGRLEEVGCVAPVDLAVETRVVAGDPPENWGDRALRIDYRERKRTRSAAVRDEGPRRLRVTVVNGSAEARKQEFDSDRTDIERLGRVETSGGRAVRHNHVAFRDDGGDVTSSVSRAHAHIAYDAEMGDWLVFDDGSAQGTRILRAGRTIDLPRQGSRGVRL